MFVTLHSLVLRPLDKKMIHEYLYFLVAESPSVLLRYLLSFYSK